MHFSSEAAAQGAFIGAWGDFLSPAAPTSSDNIVWSFPDRTCGGALRYLDNPYRVTMSQNNITVRLGTHNAGIVGVCPPAPREEYDLGRLPSGSYTLTLIEGPGGAQTGALILNAPFTVADARASKAAPYTRLDYSGQWWDPSDPGWGLFIWQDARNARDSLLAAWFTYTPDGKPMWYTFQPTWSTSTTTNLASLAQTSRPPGTSSPPPGTTSAQAVGSARLDFTRSASSTTADEGKIIYTFDSPTGGTTLTRTIKRFQP